MQGKRMITISIYTKINLKMSLGVWSTLPIFLSIHLHGSLQCYAQLTYPFTFVKLSILTIIFQKTNMCTHILIILVYASTSKCWFSGSVHFYNWHSSVAGELCKLARVTGPEFPHPFSPVGRCLPATGRCRAVRYKRQCLPGFCT